MPERRLLAAQPRGEIGFPIAGKQRMGVRVDKARHDRAIRQVEFLDVAAARHCLDLSAAADCSDRSVFDQQRRIVDAAQPIKIDAALRGAGIARDDRSGANDQSRQSMPFSSAVSIAIS